MVARLGSLIASLQKALVEGVVALVGLASLDRVAVEGDYLWEVHIGCRR